MRPLPRRCPHDAAPARAACPDRTCPADRDTPLPRRGAERARVLVLRFVAAAAETGDAACFDAAFAEAEAVFGPREGAVIVGRAAALLRAADRAGVAITPLLPPCRSLSSGEMALLAALRAARAGQGDAAADPLPAAVRLALADFAVPVPGIDAGPFPTAQRPACSLEHVQFPAVLS